MTFEVWLPTLACKRRIDFRPKDKILCPSLTEMPHRIFQLSVTRITWSINCHEFFRFLTAGSYVDELHKSIIQIYSSLISSLVIIKGARTLHNGRVHWIRGKQYAPGYWKSLRVTHWIEAGHYLVTRTKTSTRFCGWWVWTSLEGQEVWISRKYPDWVDCVGWWREIWDGPLAS